MTDTKKKDEGDIENQLIFESANQSNNSIKELRTPSPTKRDSDNNVVKVSGGK